MVMMKALVKSKPAPGIWLEDVPIPEISINDVLIKIYKSAICGTDVHIYNWDDWAQKTIQVPMHVGHEFVGVVEKIGANVHDFKPGDIVVLQAVGICA
jgi:threonine 3-dehydrogenase